MTQHITGRCYICGERSPESLDHVFPRLLFPRGSAFSNLPPRLPACLQCNNRLSRDEELFQQLLMSWRAPDTEQGRRLYQTKAGPNLRGERGRRGVRERVLEHTRLVPVIDKMGRVRGKWPVMAVPKGGAERILEKMARGLHYYENATVLPNDADIDVQNAGQNPDEWDKVLDPEILAATSWTVVGSEDILAYRRAVAVDEPSVSITWFVFYRWHIFCVTVLSAEVPEGRLDSIGG